MPAALGLEEAAREALLKPLEGHTESLVGREHERWNIFACP